MNICFTRLLRHGVDLLHMVPSPLRRHTLRPWGLSLRAYSIRNSWGFGVVQAIWEVKLSSFYFMLLNKTNITSKLYFHN